MSIDRQYDDQYARVGAKIGTSLRIRLPNDFTVRTGAAVQVQDTSEQSTTMTLATQQGVDVSFNSQERTMSLDDYSTRILAPAVNNLGATVANTIMAGVDTGGCCNFIANTDASGTVLTPTIEQWLLAAAVLQTQSAPLSDWKAVLDPYSMSRTVSSLAGLLNPAPEISRQYRSGQMYDALGYRWMPDQTVLKHTTGAYVGTGSPATVAGTVNGANQTGTSITVNALAGPLAAGDIITFDNVYGVNRLSKASYGTLRQFVVTANAATSATSISIYPSLIPPSGGNNVQYQTVTASPANSANINVATLSGTVYRKNIVYAPEAITMATADLEMPNGVDEVDRATFDGLSIRMLTDYVVTTDQLLTRLDILYGYLYVRPEWVVAVADAT